MRKLAFLTSLALAGGMLTNAYADREHERNGDRERNGERESYQRWNQSHWSRDFHGRWTPLASRFSASANRQFINVRGAERLDKLRIEADRGTPVIKQIAIEYTDGNTQKVRFDERLPAGAGEVIRLNPDQPIQRIIVYTEPGYGGQYSVYGA
jgi:hypothetical protein